VRRPTTSRSPAARRSTCTSSAATACPPSSAISAPRSRASWASRIRCSWRRTSTPPSGTAMPTPTSKTPPALRT